MKRELDEMVLKPKENERGKIIGFRVLAVFMFILCLAMIIT